MKVGDIIEWRGVNKVHHGKVTKSDTDPEGFVVQMENGHIFSLKDLRHAKSAKLIEVWD